MKLKILLSSFSKGQTINAIDGWGSTYVMHIYDEENPDKNGYYTFQDCTFGTFLVKESSGDKRFDKEVINYLENNFKYRFDNDKDDVILGHYNISISKMLSFNEDGSLNTSNIDNLSFKIMNK